MTENMMLFLHYRICNVFFLAFVLLFLRLRYGKIKTALISVGCWLMTGVTEYAIFFGDISDAAILCLNVIGICTVQGATMLMSRYRDMRAVFTGFSAGSYVLPGSVLYTGLVSMVGTSPWLLIPPILVNLAIMAATVAVTREAYLREMESNYMNWKRLCIYPACFYLIIYALINASPQIYDNLQFWVGVFFLLILKEATYALIFNMFFRQGYESELQQNIRVLETYAAGLKREAELLKKSEEKLRILRHDRRHIVNMIRSLLDEGKTEEIRLLLDQTENQGKPAAVASYCGNTVINTILADGKSRAEKAKVAFECRADVPEKLKAINEFELATVIMNLIENAVCAASEVSVPEERKVCVQIHPVKNQLFLEIANGFEGICQISETTGLPISKKGEGHGIGLQSVKAYADKWKAFFRYSVEDGRFCVRLLTNM